MNTLFDLIRPIPADRTAIILPEQNLRVFRTAHCAIRSQAVAEALAAPASAAAIASASRCRTACPMIVSFLAASMAGTAAPLNPAYKEDEFRFYLEDTDARVLILPPDGAR